MSRRATFTYTVAIAVLTGGLIAGCGPAHGRDKGQRAAGVHVVQLSTSGRGHQGKQVSVLLETPSLKIATITLRKGTVLPSHSAPTPITIQTLSGSGILRANGKDYVLAPGVLVALAPSQAHSVVPAGKGDIVVLIHHVKARRGKRAGR